MTAIVYTVVISLMLLLPPLLGAAWRRRFPTPWLLFCAGMAGFLVSQAYHIPFNNWLTGQGSLDPMATGRDFLPTAVILGLSAAVSETIMRVAVVWLLFRRRLAERWEDGAMVGLGWGGIEAAFVAVITAASFASLWALRNTDLATLSLSPDQLAALQQQLARLDTSAIAALAPLVERLLAVQLQVVLALLVWLAFRRRQPLFVLLAIGYHALVDGSLVYAAQFVDNPWLLEGLLVLLVLPGAVWFWRSYARRRAEVVGFHPAPLGRQWRVFAAMTGKELREQWKTRRLLVILVVFLLFGLVSPLLARFTPELLKSVPGAEQFADLIPEPATADALGQYLKNLTQFGFILAILTGMAAIAGEKERGTAALILSKPAPRWAFVGSKFVAQALVYLLAFALAGAAAWYYTRLLFEPLLAGPFALGNVLLWLWILAFVAVTLLASALSRTTLMAAGLALAGSVLLLILGSIPQIASILPSGLTAWAGRLGLPDAAAAPVANGGAVAGTIVVITVCLITAVAVVERQEV